MLRLIDDGFGKERSIMPTQIRENRAKKVLKNNELVLCMGVHLSAGRADVKQLRELKIA